MLYRLSGNEQTNGTHQSSAVIDHTRTSMRVTVVRDTVHDARIRHTHSSYVCLPLRRVCSCLRWYQSLAVFVGCDRRGAESFLHAVRVQQNARTHTHQRGRVDTGYTAPTLAHPIHLSRRYELTVRPSAVWIVFEVGRSSAAASTNTAIAESQ